MADIDFASPTAGFASPNFRHLAKIEPLLASLGARAEHYVFDDANTALIKLRQFGEALAQQVAASTGLLGVANEQQIDRLRRLQDVGVVDREVADLFHALRKVGNEANHGHVGSQREALHNLRIAWRLGVWFQQAFHDPQFRSGAFMPPPDPRDAELALKQEPPQPTCSGVPGRRSAKRATHSSPAPI
jgi:type I restriction enzyme R subunit